MVKFKKLYIQNKYWLIAIFFAVSIGSAVWVINESETEHINLYELQMTNVIDSLYAVSKNNKIKATGLFYDQFIENNRWPLEQSTTSLVEQASNDPSKVASTKMILELRYRSIYESMKEVGVSRIQFYLRSGECLFEIHREGDETEDAESPSDLILSAIKSKESRSGVEVRNSLCEYHFVFPVLKDGLVVGAVEFSYILRDTLRSIEQTQGYQSLLFLNENEVDPSYADPREVAEVLGLDSDEFEQMNDTIWNQNVEISKQQSTIFYEYIIDKKTFLVIMKPVQSAQGFRLGTLAFYKEDKLLAYLRQHKKIIMTIVVGLSSLIFLMAMLVLYLLQKYRNQANRDALTKLYNRNYSVRHLEGIINKGVVFMIDIDDFKDVNDTYGHLKGDYVLELLARLIKRNIRNEDFAVRWGGEEFMIVIKNVDLKMAGTKADDLCKIVRKYDFDGLNITISIGVSQIVTNLNDAINSADMALYKAKNNGKNQMAVTY